MSALIGRGRYARETYPGRGGGQPGAGSTMIPAPFGAPYVQPPPKADWTIFNAGPNNGQVTGLTAADVPGGIELVADFPTSPTTSLEGILRPLPAPLATSRVRAAFYWVSPVEFAAALFVRNSTTSEILSFSPLAAFEIAVQDWTNENTPNGSPATIFGTASQLIYWYELSIRAPVPLAGTFNVSASATVPSSVSQVGAVLPGDFIQFTSQIGTFYRVLSVAPTQIVLTTAYTGAPDAATDGSDSLTTLKISTDGKRFIEVFAAQSLAGANGWGFALTPQLPSVPTPPASVDVEAATLVSWQEFTS